MNTLMGPLASSRMGARETPAARDISLLSMLYTYMQRHGRSSPLVLCYPHAKCLPNASRQGGQGLSAEKIQKALPRS